MFSVGQPQCSSEQNEILTVALTEPWFLFFLPLHMDVIYIHKLFLPTVYNFFFFSISSHGDFLDKTIMIRMSWEAVSDEAVFLNMYRQRKRFPYWKKSLQSTQTRPRSSSGFLSVQQLGQQLSRRAGFLVPGLNLSRCRAQGSRDSQTSPAISFTLPSAFPTHHVLSPSQCLPLLKRRWSSCLHISNTECYAQRCL